MTLEQHRCKLCRSTYTLMIFSSKYYSTWSRLWLNPRIQSSNLEEPLIWKAESKLYLGFLLWRGQCPNPYVVQRSTVLLLTLCIISPWLVYNGKSVSTSPIVTPPPKPCLWKPLNCSLYLYFVLCGYWFLIPHLSELI